MKLNQENKQVRIVNVSLKGFIATLMELYDLGAEYIDLVVSPDVLQDNIQIHIREQSKKRKLTEDDIYQLIA
jgi:hypothetical protein